MGALVLALLTGEATNTGQQADEKKKERKNVKNEA